MFPERSAASRNEQSTYVPVNAPADGQSTVLIVEGEAQILLTQSVLEGADYETLTATTVAEAQAIINSDKKLDLMVPDITLSNHPKSSMTIGSWSNDVTTLYDELGDCLGERIVAVFEFQLPGQNALRSVGERLSIGIAANDFKSEEARTYHECYDTCCHKPS